MRLRAGTSAPCRVSDPASIGVIDASLNSQPAEVGGKGGVMVDEDPDDEQPNSRHWTIFTAHNLSRIGLRLQTELMDEKILSYVIEWRPPLIQNRHATPPRIVKGHGVARCVCDTQANHGLQSM